MAIVNGNPEHHPEGSYYLEWRDGARRVRLSVGTDAADACARRLRKEAELHAVNNGVKIVPEGDNGRRSLAGPQPRSNLGPSVRSSAPRESPT